MKRVLVNISFPLRVHVMTGRAYTSGEIYIEAEDVMIYAVICQINGSGMMLIWRIWDHPVVPLPRMNIYRYMYRIPPQAWIRLIPTREASVEPTAEESPKQRNKMCCLALQRLPNPPGRSGNDYDHHTQHPLLVVNVVYRSQMRMSSACKGAKLSGGILYPKY